MTPAVRVARWMGALAAMAAALLGAAAVAGVLFFFVVIRDLPSIPEPLKRIIETPPTEIFAANGERILQIGGREYVPLDQIASTFIQAILATEDHRFWDHHGVNKLRTLKALWVTFFPDDRVQGASTITQQLAKNLFFTFEQTWSRKFKELMVSFQIESQFSKQEILEAYVNQIYFGPNAQGVGPAAQLFFGKPAAQLTLPEAALLAGLPKSPTRYNPFRHLERARNRQKVVLARMVASGLISPEQADEAQAAAVALRRQSKSGRAGGYFVDWVLKSLEERYGAQAVYHGGLKVTTTMDPHLQFLAQQAVTTGLDEMDKIVTPGAASDGNKSDNRVQAALVAVQVNSGAVKAMVGGRNYAETEFNRAVDGKRQAGSAFKPFLYYTALEKLGLTPASVVVDRQVNIPVIGAPDWRPHNFRRGYHGPVILKKAFTESLNSVAAQLVEKTGPDAVIDTARRCGIQSPLSSVYSVALGSSGVSPLEMASAFATFASSGVHYAPFGIWRVEDAFGQVLEEHIVGGDRVLNPQLAFQMVDMMQGVIDYGTGEVVRRLGFDKPAGGKTGTTNEYKDAWFTGFTPTLSVSVWMGCDQPVTLKDQFGVGITGGRGAVPIWTRFMQRATDGEPVRPFLHPPGIQVLAFDPVTGRPVDSGTASAMPAAVRQGGSMLQGQPQP